MMYVALLEGIVLVTVALSFTGIVRWLIRQQARERELLVNQICSLSGKPWLPAPADTWEPDEDAADPRQYIRTPEQLPDY